MSPYWGTLRPVHGLIEAVPNFSVGSDRATIDAIAGAIEAHARVLDMHSDADHNRSVFTCVGEPGALVEGLAARWQVAIERIDLRTHVGVHPRVGAADVIPFVRFAPDDPGAASWLPARSASGSPRWGFPALATASWGRTAARRSFARAGLSGLSERLAAGEIVARVRPGADPRDRRARCCSACGRRWSPSTSTWRREDGAIAAEIAAAVRASSGGLPGVQAIGLVLALDRAGAGLDEPDRHRRRRRCGGWSRRCERLAANAGRGGGRLGAGRPDAGVRGLGERRSRACNCRTPPPTGVLEVAVAGAVRGGLR